MFFSYSFNYLILFLKIVFNLCNTNEVAVKLYTLLCSFINNLNDINYLIILNIWELLSPFQFEAGVGRKLCDKFKVLKNQIESCLLESIICMFLGGAGFMSGSPCRNPNHLVSSTFSNCRKRYSILFNSSCIIVENNTNGISSWCIYRFVL